MTPLPSAQAAYPWPAIQVVATKLPGCFELRPSILTDARGSFAKVFHQPLWEAHGLCTRFVEDFVTHSGQRVLRGLHFQSPPMQQTKVVQCLRGRVFDVALDLRVDSPTFGSHVSLELSGELSNALYLPPGVAHGFCVLEQEALLYYKASTIHSPAQDAGIRWDSAGIAWPIEQPLLSTRDSGLPALSDFQSPFTGELP